MPLEDVLHLRNAVLEADDLRRPVDLQDQVREFSPHSATLCPLRYTDIQVQPLNYTASVSAS